ncbi:hypothetical protein GOP80_06060 [Planococcaceae bacterium Storch 2/2-2]|nr:hypothetical protein [Planococcaceae bacterium Storch 2/2-2]
MKKSVALLATTAVVATAVAPVQGATFSDVNDRYKDAVHYLVSQNITNGTSATTFGTDETIKRVDAAVMIAKALKIDGKQAKDANFKDVPNRAKPYVNGLKEKGIINGKTATTFGADDNITRGEIAMILQRAYRLEGKANVTFSDVGARYKKAVEALVAHQITNGVGKGKFGTDQAVKRGDFAFFLYKVAHLNGKPAPTPPAKPTPETPDVPAKGDVHVLDVQFLSASEVFVKFNTTMVPDQLKKKSNYLIHGREPDYVIVDPSNRSVILQYAHTIESDNSKIVIRPMQSKANKNGKPVLSERYEAASSYKDEKGPRIESATYDMKTKRVTLYFNEKLSSVPTAVTVNGKKVPASQIVLNKDAQKQVFITNQPFKMNETIQLVVEGAKDVATNKNTMPRHEVKHVVGGKTTVNVADEAKPTPKPEPKPEPKPDPKPEQKPTVSKVEGSNVVQGAYSYTITFSEAVDGADELDSYVLDGKPLPRSTALQVSEDKKRVVLTFPKNTTVSDDIIHGHDAKLTVRHVKNASGQTIEPVEKTVRIFHNSEQTTPDRVTYVNKATAADHEAMDALLKKDSIALGNESIEVQVDKNHLYVTMSGLAAVDPKRAKRTYQLAIGTQEDGKWNHYLAYEPFDTALASDGLKRVTYVIDLQRLGFVTGEQERLHFVLYNAEHETMKSIEKLVRIP